MLQPRSAAVLQPAVLLPGTSERAQSGRDRRVRARARPQERQDRRHQYRETSGQAQPEASSAAATTAASQDDGHSSCCCSAAAARCSQYQSY